MAGRRLHRLSALRVGEAVASICRSRVDFHRVLIHGMSIRHAYQSGWIIMIDPDWNRLEVARRFGATDCIDARAGDTAGEIMTLTDGIGVDCAIEAVGIAWRERGALRVVDGAVGQSGRRRVFSRDSRSRASA